MEEDLCGITYSVPVFLEEKGMKAIWARGFKGLKPFECFGNLHVPQGDIESLSKIRRYDVGGGFKKGNGGCTTSMISSVKLVVEEGDAVYNSLLVRNNVPHIVIEKVIRE